MTDTIAELAPIPDCIFPQTALQAALATDFRSFIEYTFGVLRPGVEFRPNWHNFYGAAILGFQN
jgi:hypothetical protein